MGNPIGLVFAAIGFLAAALLCLAFYVETLYKPKPFDYFEPWEIPKDVMMDVQYAGKTTSYQDMQGQSFHAWKEKQKKKLLGKDYIPPHHGEPMRGDKP